MSKLTLEQVAEMVRLREECKMRPPAIAPRFGVTVSTVNYQLLRNGVDPWDREQPYDPKRRGGFTPEEDRQMLDLGVQGLSPFQIALKIKRPKTSVLIRILTLEVRAEKALERAAA